MGSDRTSDWDSELGIRNGLDREVEMAAFDVITIGYETNGSLAGEPVFLLHGFPDTTATWDGVVDVLSAAGCRLVCPYVRGHGPTRVNDGYPITAETAALAEDVLLLADHLGIESFHLVGSDWGCRAAYALAGLEPDRVRSLVTLGTGYNEATSIIDLSLDQVASFWYQWLFQTEHGEKLLRDDRTGFCRHLWKVWSPDWDLDDAEFELVARAVENSQFVDTVLHYYRYRWGNAAVSDRYRVRQALVDAMPDIKVATTHVQGMKDHCTRPETATRWEGRVKAPYRRVDLEKVGHFPQREVPDVVARVILEAVAVTA